MSFILSIKPTYAQLIYKRIKTVELRRRMPKVFSGHVFFYETIPEQSITGIAKIGKVISGPPHGIMMQVLRLSGISLTEYNAYFSGAKMAYAMFIYDVLHFDKPIRLRQLREIWSGFHPPQNYRYLNTYAERVMEVGMSLYESEKPKQLSLFIPHK